jgi:hypothetical protein
MAWFVEYSRTKSVFIGKNISDSSACFNVNAGSEKPEQLFSLRLLGSALSDLLGFVVGCQSYNYISLFVSFIDIPVSLDNLFQRIASIYDRFYLPRLNKLFEEY